MTLPSLPRVRRSERGRVVAGVCSGIAERLRVDPTVIRLLFAILAFAGGSGIVLYFAGWILLPPPARSRTARIGGLGLLIVAGFLAVRGLGLEDSLIWPGAVIALGVVLVARRPRSIARLVFGGLLIMGGTAFFAESVERVGGGDGLVQPGAVAIALLAIMAPWLWQLAQERDAERLDRTRTEERAEVAGRVHDSVMQTLALIQRHAEDPRRVATLARSQERELRTWLYGRSHGGALVAAVERAAAEVEDLYGVRVDVVAAGDAELDERLEAVVLAAREAMTNAAKFSGVDEVSVYVEAGAGKTAVFVRDTGAGFDRNEVPSDRHGLRDSIEARLERHGGAATIASEPGGGTEVELRLPA